VNVTVTSGSGDLRALYLNIAPAYQIVVDHGSQTVLSNEIPQPQGASNFNGGVWSVGSGTGINGGTTSENLCNPNGCDWGVEIGTQGGSVVLTSSFDVCNPYLQGVSAFSGQNFGLFAQSVNGIQSVKQFGTFPTC